MRMEEKTLRRVSEFIDNPDNGAVARSMCASVIASMAQKYRYRTDDYGIDYTNLLNITLLGEDFYRSVPEPALDSVRREISFGTIRDMNFRFSTLMDETKPQNLSKTPAFTTLSEKEQRNARVALVIANTYYTGASTSNRHRESELLECVDKNFEKRFDIAAILDRHMDATPSLIEEILTIETRSFQDGWL